MTFLSLTKVLEDAGVEDAAFDASLLIEHFCGVSRALVLAEPEKIYDDPALSSAAARRAAHYPLQYLLGEWSFMGLSFEVNESVLIPRADTEGLAEDAIRLLPENGRFLDLCTGSGCIAAAVLACRPDARAVAADLSPDAVRVAERNLEQLGLSDRCHLVTADAAEDAWAGDETFDLITVNPPYVAETERETLAPELAWEPSVALFAGEDGLDLYRAILPLWGRHLNPGGVLLAEHGAGQRAALLELAESTGWMAEGRADLAGRDRWMILWPR